MTPANPRFDGQDRPGRTARPPRPMRPVRCGDRGGATPIRRANGEDSRSRGEERAMSTAYRIRHAGDHRGGGDGARFSRQIAECGTVSDERVRSAPTVQVRRGRITSAGWSPPISSSRWPNGPKWSFRSWLPTPLAGFSPRGSRSRWRDGPPRTPWSWPGPMAPGSRCFDSPPGRLTISYRAEIEPVDADGCASDQTSEVGWPAGAGSPGGPGDLERLVYLRPSRYCPSDHLVGFAVAEFGTGPTIRTRAEAVPTGSASGLATWPAPARSTTRRRTPFSPGWAPAATSPT